MFDGEPLEVELPENVKGMLGKVGDAAQKVSIDFWLLLNIMEIVSNYMVYTCPGNTMLSIVIAGAEMIILKQITKLI